MTDRTPGRSAPPPPGRGAARAPLLAVVGGPTGAGKSTLLNSLVRAPVSAAGVLRPTTRRPVLVCNPRDWASVRRHGLRPICAPLMPEGMAVIDAPDIDSIEPANRALADELFAEADLWLFVTTASRYADAANWRHLSAARARRTALAVVLDRVASGHAQGIIDHMRDLLGPPEPPLFVIPEVPLDRQGMLPDSIAAPLRGWLADVVYAARTGPPQPAIGVAPVAAANMATGLTVELEITPAKGLPAADIAAASATPFDAWATRTPTTEPSDASPVVDDASAGPGTATEEAADTTTEESDDGATEKPGDRTAEAGADSPFAAQEAADPSPPPITDASPEPPAAGPAHPQPNASHSPAASASTVGGSAAPNASPATEAAENGEVAEAPAVQTADGGVPGGERQMGSPGVSAGRSDVVESDSPDGLPDRPTADIPKAADVGETVKL